MGGADRRGEAGFGAEGIAAADESEIVGAATQLVDEIGNQIVEPAGFANQADQRLTTNRAGGSEDGGFDSEHPFTPAGRGRQVEEFDVEAFVPAQLATASGGAHRPYSRKVGLPDNSRAAPRATSWSNSRRAARPVIGAWRAASAGETQSWASRRSTIFWAGFDRSLGATAIRIFERRERSEARSRAEAAASAIAPEAALGQGGWPGFGRRAAPGERTVGSRILAAMSGTSRAQRSRMAMAMSNIQSAKISEGGAGASGTAESEVEPRCRVKDPGWVEAGRPAGAIAPERRKTCHGAERVAEGEAEVARRGFVGVEAQDFCASRGALQCEAGAERPAGGGSARRNASRSASPAPAANSGSDSPVLPLARAQVGIGEGGEKPSCSTDFVGARRMRRGCWSDAVTRSRGGLEAARRESRNQRESPAHGESSAALCHGLWLRNRLACRELAASDKIAVSDT
jgi:hypothetical protein